MYVCTDDTTHVLFREFTSNIDFEWSSIIKFNLFQEMTRSAMVLVLFWLGNTYTTLYNVLII